MVYYFNNIYGNDKTQIYNHLFIMYYYNFLRLLNIIIMIDLFV